MNDLRNRQKVWKWRI